MYRKVLVPIDGTREAEGLSQIILEDLASDGELVLLQIIPPARTRVVGGHVLIGSQQDESERGNALSYLRGLAGADERVRCEATIADSVPEGIVKAAEREGVDLIAMYTHDRHGLARLMKGNIAREVIRSSPVEVQVLTAAEVAERAPVGAVAAAMAAAGMEPATPPLTSGVFRETDLFRDLSLDQVDRVTALGERIHFAVGDALGVHGEPAQKLFVIIHGEAQLSAYSDMGEITVRVAGPGESFPLAALLGSGTLITSGEAITEMDVLAIPVAELSALCEREPALGSHVYRSAAQIFAARYSNTLIHLAASAERELRDAGDT